MTFDIHNIVIEGIAVITPYNTVIIQAYWRDTSVYLNDYELDYLTKCMVQGKE